MDLFDLVVAKKLSGGGGGGSSDFSLAQVTFVNRQSKSISVACVADSEEPNVHGSAPNPLPGSSCQAILYKGVAYVFTSPLDIASTSGNIEYDENMNCYVITGDCTITFA